jgi:hypothetical protein
MKTSSGNEIGFDGFGIKAKFAFGNYNPDARFINKKQTPFSSFLDRFLAYLLFMASLFGILICVVYLIALVVTFAKTGKILPLKIFFVFPLSVGGIIYAPRHNDLTQERESEYWSAYESMAEVATCPCGKIISPLPPVLIK